MNLLNSYYAGLVKLFGYFGISEDEALEQAVWLEDLTSQGWILCENSKGKEFVAIGSEKLNLESLLERDVDCFQISDSATYRGSVYRAKDFTLIKCLPFYIVVSNENELLRNSSEIEVAVHLIADHF